MTWNLPDGSVNQTFSRSLGMAVTDADGRQRAATKLVSITYVLDSFAAADLRPPPDALRVAARRLDNRNTL